MVQRFFNLDKWTTLNEGEQYTLRGSRVREIRLEVNAEFPCRIHAYPEDSPPVFLAYVHGRDSLVFHAGGTIHLQVDGGPLELYSVDGDDISQVVEAPESFTKPMQRRPRSPEFERVAWELNANMERRFAQQAEYLRRFYENRAPVGAPQRAAAGVPAAAGQEPASDVKPVAPDPSGG